MTTTFFWTIPIYKYALHVQYIMLTFARLLSFDQKQQLSGPQLVRKHQRGRGGLQGGAGQPLGGHSQDCPRQGYWLQHKVLATTPGVA